MDDGVEIWQMSLRHDFCWAVEMCDDPRHVVFAKIVNRRPRKTAWLKNCILVDLHTVNARIDLLIFLITQCMRAKFTYLFDYSTWRCEFFQFLLNYSLLAYLNCNPYVHRYILILLNHFPDLCAKIIFLNKFYKIIY